MTVKFALPAGDARPVVGNLLERAGIPANGYEPSSRLIRSVDEERRLTFRIFREKDIPIQVAMGNYALGICGDVWVSELQARFPRQHVVRVGGLPGPRTSIWLCAAPSSGLNEGLVPGGPALSGARIVTEFANIADLVAVKLRIPAYRLLAVAGSADAYAPEDAELVLVPAADAGAVRAKGLVPLVRIFSGGMALIANRDALASQDLGSLLGALAPLLEVGEPSFDIPSADASGSLLRSQRDQAVARLALPDGHAQRATPGNLRAAGLEFEGYDEQGYVRRPSSNLDGLTAKVVRPQDMPQLVAMGMFDIAITGRDLLHEHLCRFPGSPVKMAVDLGQNRYRIGPVVPEDFPANTTVEAIQIWSGLGRPVRIASEFPATAERFALDHGIRPVVIIPVAGASEGFVPEDADLLIEGTETGTSLRANHLKMLDPFMESTNCVIVRTVPATSRTDVIEDLVHRFERAVSGAAVTA